MNSIGLVTGTKDTPLCIGSSSLLAWWVLGSDHGGIGETLNVYKVSTRILIEFNVRRI